MKKQILLSLSLILMVTGFTYAQAKRTVTNEDLEKYRQQRERADAEYRATYKQRGLPSPEEIQEIEAKRRAQLAEDADRARAAQRAEYEMQRQQALTDAQINYLRSQTAYPQNQGSAFVGGQLSAPLGYGGYYSSGYYGIGNSYRNYQRRGVRQGEPLPPNMQIVKNAANSFPTANDIRNQIYGIPPQVLNGRGAGSGNRPGRQP